MTKFRVCLNCQAANSLRKRACWNCGNAVSHFRDATPEEITERDRQRASLESTLQSVLG